MKYKIGQQVKIDIKDLFIRVGNNKYLPANKLFNNCFSHGIINKYYNEEELYSINLSDKNNIQYTGVIEEKDIKGIKIVKVSSNKYSSNYIKKPFKRTIRGKKKMI